MGFNHGVHRELSVLFSNPTKTERRRPIGLWRRIGLGEWLKTTYSFPSSTASSLSFLKLSRPPFSLTACLNETLLWLCGLWSLTVRLKTMEHVCAQRYTPSDPANLVSSCSSYRGWGGGAERTLLGKSGKVRGERRQSWVHLQT